MHCVEKNVFLMGLVGVCDAANLQIGVSAGAVSGCGFALAAIGMACKCRPGRAAKRRNLKRKKRDENRYAFVVCDKVLLLF